MKTTLEIPEPLFRRAKVLAASRGITLKQLVTEALGEKLRASTGEGEPPAWRALAGKLGALRAETAKVLARIEEDSEQIDEA